MTIEENAALFSQSLNIPQEDLEEVGRLISYILSPLAIDAERVFTDLCAGRSLAAALSIPPQAIPVLYARAHSWFAIDRYDKASVLFRALCTLAPDVADHWIGLGICLKAQGLHHDAIHVLEISAQKRPDWALPYIHLTEAFMRLRDRDKAKSALEAYDQRDHGPIPELLQIEAERYRAFLFEQDEDLASTSKQTEVMQT